MKKLQLDYRFFWALLGIEAVVLLAFVAPFVIGRYCGHGWGLLTAIADLVGWFYLSLRCYGKRRLTVSTRIIWLLMLVCLVVIAAFELTHLSP
jgi:hypothetical protein